MTVHVLGTGAIGCYVASVLKKNNHNVSLLLRSRSHLKEFNGKGNTITFNNLNKIEFISGFNASNLKEHNSPITSLVVATKSQHTLEAVSSIAPYLSPSSSILFLQNGMGSVDQLVKKVWSKENVPSLHVGVNLHAVERSSPYEIRKNSLSEGSEVLTMAQYPGTAKCKHQLTEAIADIPEFQAKCLPWESLYKRMLKKIFVNSSLNAVAAVIGEKNKIVLNPYGQVLLQSVCEEAWEVFKNDLPEESLESMIHMVKSVSEDVGDNVCSTLQDIRSGRPTEIDYINGYISRLGKERNICTKTNDSLINLIRIKETSLNFQ
ncbi:2-dehydropantoate 2-reductase [Sporodiniella umbellata]|nr:2-dehydropantoate 2-reductase [Sporodiniella umbellata]